MARHGGLLILFPFAALYERHRKRSGLLGVLLFCWPTR